MKAALAALLVVAVMISLTAWNAMATQAFLDDLIAAESISEKRSLWEENRYRLRLTINRRTLCNIEIALDQLEACNAVPNAPEAITAQSTLKQALESIRALESLIGLP